MKFDAAVINPPYGGKSDPLYLRITRSALSAVRQGGVLVSLMPSSWTDRLRVKSRHGNPIDKYLSMPVVSVESIDSTGERTAQHRMKDLDASFSAGLAIFTFIPGSHSCGLGDFAFRKFSDRSLAHSIYCKCCLSGKGILGRLVRIRRAGTPVGKHIVYLSGVRGNPGYWDWTTMMSSKFRKPVSAVPDKRSGFIRCFDSYDEAQRFIDYLNTDFAMFCLYLVKTANTQDNGELDYVPELPSYSDLSDSYIAGCFGLTAEEMSYVHKEMKPFGWKKCNEI